MLEVFYRASMVGNWVKTPPPGFPLEACGNDKTLNSGHVFYREIL